MLVKHWAPDRVLMTNTGCKPWGVNSLVLELPALRIRFTGLSAPQHTYLKQGYKNFIPELQKHNTIDVDCDIVRLDAAPNLTIDELTVDGQYAPQKIAKESPGCFKVTGDDFEAHFDLRSTNYTSTLGTLKEHELTKAPVIENYMRILAAHWVLRSRGLVLHSAGLVIDGKAYIFSGRSNAGKTTLTRKAHKTGAQVLSDDINLLLPDKDGYAAYAVPFTGEFGRTLCHPGGSESYPLAGVILLEQGDHLNTHPVTSAAAVARLLTGCPFVNTDKAESALLFDAVSELVAKVRVIKLTSGREDNFDEIFEAVNNELGNRSISNSAPVCEPPSLQTGT